MDLNKRRKLMLFSLILNAAIVNIILLRRIQRQKRRNRRWWVRPINVPRHELGHHRTLFEHMKVHDAEEFFEYTRMWPDKFHQLLQLTTPYLRKNSIRKPLSPELRLALTLSYLAHGDSVRSKAWGYLIGRSTAFKIIPEVCEAIWRAVQPMCLPPMTPQRWAEVAKGFEEMWQFPLCVGAIDGKHIRIRSPPSSGTQYFNYKKFFSIVLLATCDHQYRFTWVDIGQYGSVSDAGVWSRSDFGAAFENGDINFPPPKPLPQTNILSHHVLVGDEAFPLKTELMRPYSRRDLQDAERIFNYRLSRARRIIENAFGILTVRWQILSRQISCSPDNVTRLVKALVCLHNFIMISADDPLTQRYCPPGMVDMENDEGIIECGEWRRLANHRNVEDVTRIGPNNAPRNAVEQRNLLKDYFISPIGESQVPWQYTRAFRGLDINQGAQSE